MNVLQLFDLTGRVAIITGGSIGLGRQMAEGLAEMGANLVLCARKKERCEQAAAELQNLGVKTLALGCDVKNPAEVQAVVDAAMSEFGRIDILINNAGTSWGAPVEQMRLEHWNKVIETNLTGTFLFSQAAGKFMTAQRRGKIINIASVAGIHGAPPEFQAIGYHASKGGVIAYQGFGLQVGHIQHSGKLDCSGLVPHKHVASRDRTKQGRILEKDSGTTIRQ